MLGHLSTLAGNWVEHWGLWGLLVAMLLESACIPIPSEVTVPLAGYLAGQGAFPLWLVILVGTLGNTIGSLIVWAIAHFGRDAYLQQLPLQHARKHLDTAERWFERWGLFAVFFGRLLPIVRTYISLPAGFFKSPAVPFTVLTFIGSLIWTAALALAGYWLGGHWTQVEHWGKPVTFLVAVAILVFGWRWILSIRRNRTDGDSPEPPTQS